jgi:ubiquinone/menaquinone biosynthesis C-methylase UbiE
MFNSIWEKVYTTQSWPKYPGEDLVRFITKHFYNKPHRNEYRLLEVGCGTGANIWYFAKEGFSFTGIDGSTSAIAQATTRLNLEVPDWKTRGSLYIGEIESLPFQDQQFDAVIDHECVYCNSTKSSMRIYREMARVLKVGGKFFSKTVELGSWGDHTGTRLEENYYIPAEGPLAGKGPARFTDVDFVPELISSSITIDTIERVIRIENTRSAEVKELIIWGTKNHA